MSTPLAVDSWSFGVCNSGQCTSSSQSAAKGQPTKASWDLATGKGARTASSSSAVIGDLDGDGTPDLAFAAAQDVVYGLSFTFQKITVPYQAACASGHIDSATLSRGDDVYVISNVSIVCDKVGTGAVPAPAMKSGIVRIDSTPARISTNMTVAREASAPSISERCSGGACADGNVTMTFTGGQMKHTKTGHVTLMK